MLFFSSATIADEIKPFTTDGCSLFPNGTFDSSEHWLDCCIQHDLAYWQGGSEAERLKADQALEQCVIALGEPEIAKVMLAGVRVGGSPYFPTWYRWGYGWPYLRGYAPLTDEEKSDVAEKLEQVDEKIRANIKGNQQVD